jgi:Prolipoprotein diacylglyceryl transferase
MDAAAPALRVAQPAGRVGNYFKQELFGGPTSLPWPLHIDPAHRPDGYVRCATLRPTFLYVRGGSKSGRRLAKNSPESRPESLTGFQATNARRARQERNPCKYP